MSVTILAARLVVLAAAARGQVDPPAGFTSLFNGVDLSGWWGCGTEDPLLVRSLAPDELAARRQASLADIRAHWSVVGGALENDGEGLFLTTDRDFDDFELRLEFRIEPGADSGIYLRGMPQVQIWDTTEAGGKWPIGAARGSGGLWNNAPGSPGRDPAVRADRDFGSWNEVRVVMVGERVSAWLNGEHVVDHARMHNYFRKGEPLPVSGPIQLQTHGGRVGWRNLVIREIGARESNAILAAGGPDRVAGSPEGDGFERIFNGVDWTGWSGPTDHYEIVDGSLQCRAGKGGTIFTAEEYGDFAVRFEFLLPPGGNNGLAIRYPGEGDPAYVGMCELQVLDSEHPMYANLDPRQHHGSAYGQAAAARGYLRPTGEWNAQEVTVIGSRITVELNGTTILDADLATVTQYMYEPEKFAGRHRTRGAFGFAGHNDPVRFRNVRVRRLD